VTLLTLATVEIRPTCRVAECLHRAQVILPFLDRVGGFAGVEFKMCALLSRSRNRDDKDISRVVATLTMFWKLKLLSPRSTVPMKVRWTPHLSARAS
jgi:hypothetical protein